MKKYKIKKLLALLLVVVLLLPNVQQLTVMAYENEGVIWQQELADTTAATASDAMMEVDLKERIYEGDDYQIRYIPYSVSEGLLNGGICITNISDQPIENWKLKLENDYLEILGWGMEPEENDETGTIYQNRKYAQDINPGESVMITFLAKIREEIYPASIEILKGGRKLNPEDYLAEYEVMNSWNSGANASISITNNSTKIIEDWRLEFDFDGNIPSFWTALIVSHEGSHYIIKNAGYNANIEAGQTLTLGFSYYYESGNEPKKPTGYILNDLALGTLAGEMEEYVKYQLYPLYLSMNHYEGSIADVDIHADYDGDGLTNEEEYILGTFPGNCDSDGDGLSDYEEYNTYETNPLEYDTDGDGLSDGCEVINGTNPLVADTDGNGIIDGDETVYDQKLTYQAYKWADMDYIKADVTLKVSGHGDYSRQIQVKTNPKDTTYADLKYMVTNVVDIVHNEDMEYTGAEISFRLSPEVIAENKLNDLYIVRLDDEGIVVCETERNSAEGTVSARVDKLCKYVVISKSRLVKISDFSESKAMLDDGKAEIVFIVDTTASMGAIIARVKEGINAIARKMGENKVDVRYGLVEFQDIYHDGVNSTVVHGWSDNPDELAYKLSRLYTKDGGDFPETPLDGIDKALKMETMPGYSRYFIVVTNAYFHNGIQGNSEFTVEDMIEVLNKHKVNVSVVTSPYYYGNYQSLVTKTGGILCNMSENFVTGINPLTEQIKTDAHETDNRVIRLKNLTLANVSLDEDADTDGDGVPDIVEIGSVRTAELFGYTIEYYDNYSDPLNPDTDGDGINDGEDPRVNQYDIMYTEVYEHTIESSDKGQYPVDQFFMNTGKMTFSMFCDEYTAVDFCNDVNIGHISGNRLYKHLRNYLEVMESTTGGRGYTLEEIIYLGHTDPELAKLLARNLDMEDWKRIYAGLIFGNYDGRTGKIYTADGEEGPTNHEIWNYFYLPNKAQSISDYIGKSLGYLIGGRFVNDGTVLSLTTDITLAFFGLDLYSDIRDSVYLGTHWENTEGCYIEAGLLALQYAPVLGAFIKGEKAFVAIKQSRLTCKIVRTTSNAIETVKKTGVIRYGSELVFTTKQAVEKLGARVYNKIQDAVYRLEKSGVVINSGTKNSIAQAFSELPDGYALAIANSTDDLDSAVYKMVKNSSSQTADEMGEILQKEVKDGELAKVVGKSEGSLNSNLAQYGDDFGKMGQYVENPNIKVDWSQYAAHGAERMQQRGMTQEMIENIIENGKVLSQSGGNKFAYITREGVAVVSKEGKLITGWTNANFDEAMINIVSKLFGE